MAGAARGKIYLQTVTEVFGESRSSEPAGAASPCPVEAAGSAQSCHLLYCRDSSSEQRPALPAAGPDTRPATSIPPPRFWLERERKGDPGKAPTRESNRGCREELEAVFFCGKGTRRRSWLWKENKIKNSRSRQVFHRHESVQE